MLSRLSILAALLLLSLVAFLIRIQPAAQIFPADGSVRFTGIDAYYHMRIVDNIVANFPFISSFDPYFVYPDGAPVSGPMLFPWLVAASAWLIGLGHPSQQLVDTVGAYFPAVLGALTIIPVFGIGAALFSRWAGLLSAAVFAVLPGEFLGRSTLGFTDQHVAEVLFSATAVWLLIASVKAGRGRRAFDYAVLAGVFLLAYLLTWAGALMLLFVIALSAFVQVFADKWRGKLSEYLYLSLLFAVPVSSALAFFVLPSYPAQTAVLLGTGAGLWVLLVLQKMYRTVLLPAFGLRVAGALGICLVGVLLTLSPSALRAALAILASTFIPSSTAQTTMEAQPILFPGGSFSFSIIWMNFGATTILSLVGLTILIISQARSRLSDPGRTLFVIWSLVVLAMMLGQRRFAYYFIINAAVLSGFFVWWIGSALCQPAKIARRRAQSPGASRYTAVVIVLLGLLAVIMAPSVRAAANTGKQALFPPSDAWVGALEWLRDNTPEPGGDPGYYLQRTTAPQLSGDPYGVLSWWDYGYWISRVARRYPTVNPAQNSAAITDVAKFLTAQDEDTAQQYIADKGVRYIVLDHTLVTAKFWAIARWAGADQSKFFDVYYRADRGKMVPVMLYYPDYYRTMLARLFLADGNASAIRPPVWVVRPEDRRDSNGVRYKFIADSKGFGTLREAQSFVDGQPGWLVVGVDPQASPAPIPPVRGYYPVFASGRVSTGPGSVAEVKVFAASGN